MDESAPSGLRDRIARQGEDALGKLAQDLLENPLVTGAISRAFEARERAVAAQEKTHRALDDALLHLAELRHIKDALT